MLILFLGPDWTANRQAVLQELSRDVAQKLPGRVLLVPELISHDMERRLCQVAGDTASRYAQVLSFTRLARRVCDLVGMVECMDDGGRLVAMASAARSLHSRLKTYASVQTRPEFLTEMVDAVDEFKRCCIGSQDLMAASRQTEGSLAQKLEELALLMEGYDALCNRGKRDPRDQMTWVLEQLEEIDFASRQVFYVDGFPDFTRQNLAVLEHLIGHSPKVVVSLNCDSPDSRSLAFEKAAQTARELLSIARRLAVPYEIRYIKENDTPLSFVRAGLFQGKLENNQALSQNLRLYQTSSIFDACRGAAQKILQLIHSGSRYRDISLVCADMPACLPVLKLVFGKCGIPIYVAGTEDILQSGVMATALGGLDAVLNGFETREVLRYLRSSLSPLDADTCDLLENYVYVWGIRRKTWCQDWNMHPQGLNASWDEESENQLARINGARSLVMEPLQALAAGFTAAKSLKEQVMACYRFWEDTCLADRIQAMADTMEAEGDGRSAQILDQLWEILLGAMEQLTDVLGDTAWEPEAFGKLVRLLLSQYDVGTIPAVLDAVTAGPVTAQRCSQQKHLILLGADEGSLPGYGGSSGLLNDHERVQLRDLGLPLTGGAMEGLQAEFAEIYGVFCGAEESITLFATAEPSFIFKRMEALVGKAPEFIPQEASILTEPAAAGAYLARWQALDRAKELGLQDAYWDAVYRKCYRLGTVQADTVRALHGQQLELSASQVDKQASCRLAYFLQYGLRVRERKEATVDPAEFGTFVHSVLEATVRDVMSQGGFEVVTLEQTLDIANRHSESYTQAHFSQIDSQRLQYLFRRNLQELEMVVQELWRELHQAKYRPEKWELRFGFGGAMSAIPVPDAQIPASLRGMVDRVDTWRWGNSTYFRVVDYKTGKKDVDYCDLFNGVGLQMLLYLFALEDEGKTLGDLRVPAGVQYFPARVPYLSVDGALTPEEAHKERSSQWKRQGILLTDRDSLEAMDPTLETLCCKQNKSGELSGDLADRQQLRTLKEYVLRCLRNMVDEIASGNVEPNPYTRGSSFDACTYCPYGAVCHKGSVSGRRDYKTMTAQRFWEEVGKEVSHG